MIRRPRGEGEAVRAVEKRGGGLPAVIRRPRVHQFAATLGARDAVSNHTVALHRLLRDELGCDAAIFAVSVNRGRRVAARSYFDHPDCGAPDLLVYQACTGTPVAEYVLGRPEPLVVDYHNITPSGLFSDWDPAIAAELAHGRRQLSRLARRCCLALADSAYSAAEMTALGASDVRVAPVLFDASTLTAPDSSRLRKALRRLTASATASDAAAGLGDGANGGPVWLFVGRLAPHKAQHDLLAAFALYRETLDAGARLVLAGAGSLPVYEAALRQLAATLCVSDAVTFAGSVSDEQLAAWYAAADVFVCLSDHEGFCVPLLEAIHHHLPVVAFGTAAVPETLGGAGLVIGDKSPSSVAAAVARVLADPRAGAHFARFGAARLADFDPIVTARRYTDAFAELLQEIANF